MATIATILADVFAQCGLSSTQYDVTAGTDTVDGFVISSRQAARDALDNLLRVYNFLLTEVDGKLTLIKRGGSVSLTVADGDLGARLFAGADAEPERKVETKRLQELELPFRVDLTYFSKFRDYEQATQSGVRYTKGHLQEALTLQTPLVLTEDTARSVAERILYDQWTARETSVFSLPPAYLSLVPGDVIQVPVAGNTLRFRVIQVDVALPGPLQVTAVLDDAAVFTQAAPGATVPVPGAEDTDVITTSLIAWSGNALRNDDASSVGLYLAANGSAAGFWAGSSLFWSRDGGSSYQELTVLTDPATIGTTTSVLAAGVSTALWDDTNTVDVTITSGAVPVSTSDADVQAGSNGALVGDEIIQYGTVTSLGGGSYRLSHLIRGSRGTDGHWGEHLSGERFTLLDGGPIQRVTVDDSLRARAILVKAVGSGQAVADVTPVSVFISGDEYRCWSPGHVTSSRDGGNNLTIVWDRRTRTPRGLTDAVDEPLSEDSEAYSVDVRTGSAQPITAVTNATAAVITAATHGFSPGDNVLLVGIKGMPALEGIVVAITATTTNTFTIGALDTSGMSQYVSGGTAQKIVRTITAGAQTASYSAANQTTDGFTPGNPIDISIAQMGRWGRGFNVLATV